jgi:hypothetical protein
MKKHVLGKMKKRENARRSSIRCVFMVIILIATMHVNQLNAQSNCSTAINLTSANIDSTILYSNSGPVFWFKFTAASSNYVFEISRPAPSPYAGLKYFTLYSGTCTNLVLKSVDSVNFTAINLTVGTEYYLVLNKIDSSLSYFDF